jgi:purine-binding chemotaxis protein CheW
MRRRREKVEISGDEEQIVSFRLGRETFAVKVTQVREIGKVQDITKIPKMPDYIEGVMNLRGQITTVIDLKKRFGISAGEGRTAQSRIIVAEIGDNQLGIIVDAVEDVMRISRTSISAPPKTLTTGVEAAALTGICKLGDKLVMMLDLERIMSDGDKARLGMTDKTQTAVDQKEAAEVSK